MNSSPKRPHHVGKFRGCGQYISASTEIAHDDRVSRLEAIDAHDQQGFPVASSCCPDAQTRKPEFRKPAGRVRRHELNFLPPFFVDDRFCPSTVCAPRASSTGSTVTRNQCSMPSVSRAASALFDVMPRSLANERLCSSSNTADFEGERAPCCLSSQASR